MSRQFLVDLNIVLPKGLSVDDWAYVGHLYIDLDEDSLVQDIEGIGGQVIKQIGEWLTKNPEEHDCYTETELEGTPPYFCNICKTNTTPEYNRRMQLIQERRVNPRAVKLLSN